MTLSKLIEQLESATQNKSGMFELGEDTMCAVMALALRERAEPVAVLDIQSGRKDGNKFALVFTRDAHALPDDVYNLYAESTAPVAPGEEG